MAIPASNRFPRRRHRLLPRRGFTLVEILLVITIIGVIGGVAVTVFQDASEDAQDAVLMQNLQCIRVAFERFKVDHNGRLPGFTQVRDFGDHLTKYTDAAGSISATPSPSFPFGPYLPDRAIINPINAGFSLAESSDPSNATPDNDLMDSDGYTVGWFVDFSRGVIAPNCEGQTAAGTPRIKL